ncbi:MAG TPA: accessory factor UbiK family protein [Acidisoma sp.]|jgi:BMFP domain-containing protein YqiC|uniref:accessory factor UbiK family protein n=1 Tax=Acidisoma sp. TaxID=1872115 RepID=UPI002B5B4B86|nr:accessory factor UbiK family protein [Acidisoma sp.]HTI03573.1 accessory factor UbiK family protein [Acidisoma sp.]
MTERGRFMDDLAGVAQGALSAFTGLKDEAEAVFTARVEAVIHKLDIARGEQLAAVQELAANARMGQEAADVEIAALKARVAALEAKLGLTPAMPGATPGIDPLTGVPADVPPGAPSDPMPGTPRDLPPGAAGGTAPASPLA